MRPADESLRAAAVWVQAKGAHGLGSDWSPAHVASIESIAGQTLGAASDFDPGSCPMLAQPLTAPFGCIRYGMTIEEALRGITVNAAKALKLDSEVGTLEPGKAAVVVVTDVPDYRHVVYRLGHNPVWMTIYGGRVVHRQF